MRYRVRQGGPVGANGGGARNGENGNAADGSNGEGGGEDAAAWELRVDNFWRDTIPVIERFRDQGKLFSVCRPTPPAPCFLCMLASWD